MRTHQTSAVRSLSPGEQPLDWRQRGACRNEDPDLWWPTDTTTWQARKNTTEARRICQGCPVKARCLAEALANDETEGIWGGLTEAQRRPMHARTARTRVLEQSRRAS